MDPWRNSEHFSQFAQTQRPLICSPDAVANDSQRRQPLRNGSDPQRIGSIDANIFRQDAQSALLEQKGTNFGLLVDTSICQNKQMAQSCHTPRLGQHDRRFLLEQARRPGVVFRGTNHQTFEMAVLRKEYLYNSRTRERRRDDSEWGRWPLSRDTGFRCVEQSETFCNCRTALRSAHSGHRRRHDEPCSSSLFLKRARPESGSARHVCPALEPRKEHLLQRAVSLHRADLAILHGLPSASNDNNRPILAKPAMVCDTDPNDVRSPNSCSLQRHAVYISIGERTVPLQSKADMANTRVQDICRYWEKFSIPNSLAQDTIATFKASAARGKHDKPWFIFRSWLVSTGRSPDNFDRATALEFLNLVARGDVDPPASESKYISYRAAVNYPLRVMGEDIADLTICKMMTKRVKEHHPRKKRKTDDLVWDTATLLSHVTKHFPSNVELTASLSTLQTCHTITSSTYRKELQKLRTKAMMRLACDSSLRMADLAHTCRERCSFAQGQLFYQVFLTKTHSSLAAKGKTDGVFTLRTPINTPREEADVESTSHTVRLYLQFSSAAADQFQMELNKFYNTGLTRSATERRRALLTRRRNHSLAPDLMITGDENKITFFTPLFLSLTKQSLNDKRAHGPTTRFIGLCPETLGSLQKKECARAGIDTSKGFLSSRHAATSKFMCVGDEGTAVARTKHTTVNTAKKHYTHTVRATTPPSCILRDQTIADKLALYDDMSDISSDSQESPGLLD